MKNFFNLDNPVFQFLTRIADLVICHLLCLLCCIPVVTIGASFTALAKCTQDMVLGDIGGTTRTFFSAFKENFKQGTIVWLCAAVALTAVYCDFILLKLYVDGTLYTILAIVILVFLFLILAMLSYLFPLMARYQNTVREHVHNAALLMIYKFPRTIAMVALHICPFILMRYFPTIFLYTMPFWMFMGFAFLSQLDSTLLRPVFKELESLE